MGWAIWLGGEWEGGSPPLVGPVMAPELGSPSVSSCEDSDTVSLKESRIELDGFESLDGDECSLGSGGSSEACGYASGQERVLYSGLVLGYSDSEESGPNTDVSDIQGALGASVH